MKVVSLDQCRNYSIRVLPVRAGYVLVELGDLGTTLAMLAALHDHPVPGIKEIIPAARSLMIEFDPADVSLDVLIDIFASLRGAEPEPCSGSLTEIPVRYDGEDLSELVELLKMTADEIVMRHSSCEYTVAFTGFAPGFAYLSGGDPRLTVPRRSSPRMRVPAGSVGLAGEFSGVYPKVSPGGWQLIGTTPLEMFDLDRTPATLLQPGDRVRFVDMSKCQPHEIAKRPEVSKVRAETSARVVPSATMEIISVGLPVLFQDLGRPGQACQGIGRSGAMDRRSLRLANTLVGNATGMAALEIVMGALTFKMTGHAVMAVCGAPVAITIASLNGETVEAAHDRAIALNEGDVVTLGVPSAGTRSYLAMRGGFDVSSVLGSFATDTLAQIGPPPVLSGDVIPIVPVTAGTAISLPSQPGIQMPCPGETVTLDVVLGPRTDWFTKEAVESFLSQAWDVTAQSSRVGFRLEGEPLTRLNRNELPSEATVRGAIQVPASGKPVLFLADHPITGGYPVIANVANHHLDIAGQVPVGARIVFNATNDFVPRLIPGKHS